MDARAWSPGPAALGRGVVVLPGGAVPPVAEAWPRLRVDDAVLADPTEALAWLDAAWRSRQPSVVELAVPFADVKAPEVDERPPYRLAPDFEFARERLHFLIWANRYDGRAPDQPPRWHHATRAVRLGATAVEPGTGRDGTAGGGDAAGEVVLPDGTPAWIDGGPRVAPGDGDRGATGFPTVVHVNQLWAEQLTPDRWRPPADELAPDQLAAVAHAGGPARVLAPAGSGKTRVLTARLRHLLADRGWAPGTVTALAYNTRAAEEMRSRTRDLPQAQIRTLHALGFDLLGQHHGGRPRVLDERAVRGLLEGLAPVKPRANDDVYAPYLEALAEVRSGLVPPDDVEAARDDVPGFGQLFGAYRERLHEMGAIDFDEQVYGAVEVLLRNPELRQRAQRRCGHLLVDELQDLTPAQLLMIRLLAAPAYDVYGVGDDDQVIYGYAGADPRFLVDYSSFFPGAAAYLLEVNYRCPPAVVEAASALLSYNHKRVPKEIRAGRPAGDDGDDAAPGLVVERHGDADIGGRLVEVVQEALDEGAAPADVAVLTRVNAGLLAPQVLLGEAGVPIRPAVGERMLDRTGTRAALAWLRLADAAGRDDGRAGGWSDAGALRGPDLALVARRPSRGLRPGLLRALGNGQWALSRLGGFAAGLDDDRSRNALTGLYDDLVLVGNLARDGASVAEILLTVRDRVGLATALTRLDDARSAPGGGHVDDLDALITVARAYDRPAGGAASRGAGSPWQGVGGFEGWLRERLQWGGGPPDEAAGPGVTLSTVHRVKGLEWPVVVVWDASDGVMPHRLNQVGRFLEEERRVFHVALTRAGQRAVVLARAGSPSPFLDELTGEAAHTAPEPEPERLVRSRSAPAAAGKGRARAGGGGGGGGELTPEATKRADALREWRRNRAKADNVPAYVVVNDRHLDGIARRNPQSLDELLRCDGIGPTKLDRYGDEILEVLQSV
ncbi:MAG TPA: ATP-dependent DNA helicase UvrD2 [Acidimicrobiales bacterium]